MAIQIRSFDGLQQIDDLTELSDLKKILAQFVFLSYPHLSCIGNPKAELASGELIFLQPMARSVT